MHSVFTGLNELWGRLIIDELVRNGLDCFCLSSGSRSTPIALAVAQNESIRSVIHYDERGTAFYALGVARATGKPVALICTSGTAAANFMPAVIEASVDHLPLIVLTADRPPELRESGANQTIDQVRLYGNYVRWQFDMPCPDENISPEFVLTTIDQAVYRSCRKPEGPIHINCMFREPLSNEGDKKDFSDYLEKITNWLNESVPYTSYGRPSLHLPDADIRQVADIINNSSNGIVIAGKLCRTDIQHVQALTEKTGWPLFPDIASGLRLGAGNKTVVPYYDVLLLSDDYMALRPQTVLHFGGQSVSKRLLQFLNASRPKHYIRVAEYPDRHDPNHQVTMHLESSVVDFCKKLISLLGDKQESKLTGTMSRASSSVDKTLAHLLESSDSVTEPAIARLISKHVCKNSALFLANSLPVREMDMFAAVDGASVAVEYNRGASGIDGTVAAAAGFAAELRRPVTLLIGDLALLHDLNSLPLLHKTKFPVVIVVLNNDGGGIFSFLPVASAGKPFEQFFGTPHGMDFKSAAEQFGIAYKNPSTLKQFVSEYTVAQKSKHPTLIEVKTERKQNWQFHQKIYASVTESLKQE